MFQSCNLELMVKLRNERQMNKIVCLFCIYAIYKCNLEILI